MTETSLGWIVEAERHIGLAEIPGVTSEGIGDAAVKTVTITAV